MDTILEYSTYKRVVQKTKAHRCRRDKRAHVYLWMCARAHVLTDFVFNYLLLFCVFVGNFWIFCQV